MSRKWNKWLVKTAMAVWMAGVVLSQNPAAVSTVWASAVENGYINDDQRADAHAEMKFYMETLIKRENPEKYIVEDLEDILYSGIYYIANSEKMTEVDIYTKIKTLVNIISQHLRMRF